MRKTIKSINRVASLSERSDLKVKSALRALPHPFTTKKRFKAFLSAPRHPDILFGKKEINAWNRIPFLLSKQVVSRTPISI